MSIEIIKNLEYVPMEKVLEEFQKTREDSGKKIRGGSQWIIKEGIKPVDLYCYLNGRFGPPNGLQMIFRDDDSDNLIHWHYTLKYKGNPVDIMCMSFRIEIFHSFNVSDDAKITRDEFITELKNDFSNHHRKIAEFRRKIEKWNLFINPFHRYKNVIELQLRKLEELDIENIPKPIQPSNSKEMKSFKRQWDSSIQKFTEAAALSLSIRMLAPIYAESFINLLIFLLAEEDLKNDTRQYDSFLRQQIDLRVKNLHRFCRGFYQPVDYDNVQICKDFHTLMNNRNDLLHGNINPANTTYDTVYFHGKIPLFNEFKDFNFHTWQSSMIGNSPDLAFNDYQIVQNFISYVLLCLERYTIKEVKLIMDTMRPGWNDQTKRVGVLFPPYIVDFITEIEKKNK